MGQAIAVVWRWVLLCLFTAVFVVGLMLLMGQG